MYRLETTQKNGRCTQQTEPTTSVKTNIQNYLKIFIMQKTFLPTASDICGGKVNPEIIIIQISTKNLPHHADLPCEVLISLLIRGIHTEEVFRLG
jgi:hypothetical protein